MDLYAGATTLIKIPAGATEAIAVERRVLQGDTLSPFLSNCFMEPLARWLQSSGRGCFYGCLEFTKYSPSSQVKRRTPCSSYADDSQLFCNTIPDLCLQAGKIDEYATWGNLRIQPIKCAVTGMPCADIANGSVASLHSWPGNEQLKQRLACVKIGKHQIPYAHPDKDPQKVLGVPRDHTFTQLEASTKKDRLRQQKKRVSAF